MYLVRFSVDVIIRVGVMILIKFVSKCWNVVVSEGRNVGLLCKL